MKIKPQRKNANRHTQRGMQALERSLEQDGWIGAITVAADGETFDGSARVEKTAENGMLDDAIVVRSDGTKPVIVVREDIPNAADPRAVRLGIAANRVASLNLEWEPGVLAELAGDVDLSALFTGDELNELALPAMPEIGAGGDEFDATPDDGPTRAQLGDLWIIGGVHRLLVGDCTDPANVARLMDGERAGLCFTDTPYNVDYQANESIESLKARNRRTDGLIVENDNTPDVAIKGVAQMFSVLAPGGAMYICFPAEQPSVLAQMWGDGTHLQSMIVWVKDRIVMGRKDHHYQHEPIWYGWKAGAAHTWQGGHTESTVWEIARPFDSEDHPTEKPLALPTRAIENSSRMGDLVIDFFAGSGVTLTAAHRTNRRAYLCEISPRYADVILRRAEAEGLTVERAE